MAWGRVVSHSRNVMRQSALWVDRGLEAEQRGAVLHHVRARAWAFPRYDKVRETT